MKQTPEEKYYYGSDLVVSHIKKISEEIQSVLDKDANAVYLQSFLRTDEWKNKVYTQEFYTPPQKEITKKTIKDLAEIFNKVFQQVASKAEYAGIEYNTPLWTEIRFNILFGSQLYDQGRADGDRKNYWIDEYIKSGKKAPIEKKKTKKPPKIRLASQHRLCTLDSYEELKPQLLSAISKITEKYMDRLHIDKTRQEVKKYFIEKYFIFILIQSLLDQKFIFEARSRRGNSFIAQVIEDVKKYFQEQGISLESSTKMIQRKLFTNTKSDTTGPIELSYENSLLEDISERESYFNTYYLFPRNKTIASLRAEIMEEFEGGTTGVDKTFELRNPGFYLYKDKIDSAKDRLDKIEPGEKMEVLPLIPPILQEISEYKQKQKPYSTKIEEDPKQNRKPSKSLMEVQEIFLKKYSVPMQFWPLFNIVVYKNNHYFQIKSAHVRKTDEYNKIIEKAFIYKGAPESFIVKQINAVITNKEFKENFKRSRKTIHNKREEKMAAKIQYQHRQRQIIAHRKMIEKQNPNIGQYEIEF